MLDNLQGAQLIQKISSMLIKKEEWSTEKFFLQRFNFATPGQSPAVVDCSGVCLSGLVSVLDKRGIMLHGFMLETNMRLNWIMRPRLHSTQIMFRSSSVNKLTVYIKEFR